MKHLRSLKVLPIMFSLRAVSLPLLLSGLVFLTGCVAYGSDVMHRRPAPDRGEYSVRQIDRDVKAYVRHLDRYLRLNRRQEREIRAILADRTDHLLRTTRPSSRREVYPFPREYERYHNRTVRRWWINADRDIERALDRRQREEFRRLKQGYDRRRDRDYDYRDDRYEPRRPTSRRY